MEMQMQQKFIPKEMQQKVAIIGCGLVGRSWSIVFARAGYLVNLFDTVQKQLEDAQPYLKQVAEDLHKVGLLRHCRNPQDLLDNIKYVTNLKEALDGVIWVQECTPENLESKKLIFIELEKVAAKGVILASSTSAIPPSTFTAELQTRNRCIVAHPVNPPHVIPLVELVPSPFTDARVVEEARSLMEKIGQSPIVVKKEIDSFILNRLQGAILNEAFRLVEDGYVTPEDLDRTVKDGLGLRWSFMGPFETIDLNAPGGVKDYVERYSGNMYNLSKQQADPRKWEGSVVDEVVTDRRAALPLDKLQERAKWRDNRLMQLVAHKMHVESETK